MTTRTGEAAWAYESGFNAGLAADVARLAVARVRAARPSGLIDAVEAAAWIDGFEQGRKASEEPDR